MYFPSNNLIFCKNYRDRGIPAFSSTDIENEFTEFNFSVGPLYCG